jgi:hypothetical protein
MKMFWFTSIVIGLGIGAGLELQKPLKDFTNTDLKELGITLVQPVKDPKTGFVVGGKNATALIKSLTELNGRTIEQLEKDMRPGAAGDVGSQKGFLGKDEKLLDVLAEDNRYVVDELGLTHQELAKHLHALGEIGSRLKGEEFLYHGRRFRVEVRFFKGFQFSPFHDDTKTSREAVVENLDNRKKIDFSLLVPHMIERYGFYEGKGTPYRIDPRAALEVIDFVKKK